MLEGFTQTQVSTLSVRDNLLIAGGFQGELIYKVCYLDIYFLLSLSSSLNETI